MKTINAKKTNAMQIVQRINVNLIFKIKYIYIFIYYLINKIIKFNFFLIYLCLNNS